MTPAIVHPPLRGTAFSSDRFLEDAVAGLTATPKRLSSKYFYDRRGSELFDRICELDEYYVTRTELAIMRAHVQEMADRLGPRCLVIEPGSGSGLKTRLLLSHLAEPAGYVPVDIAREQLMSSARALGEAFEGLPIWPVHADVSADFELPDVPEARRRVVYFPGSTIGNFTPPEAESLLGRLRRITGAGGGLLIGVDLHKDVSVLEAAYNDRSGVTSAFNLNVLHRIRRELGAEVDVERFDHRAFYNEAERRIEMHLVSNVAQAFRLNGTTVRFEPGETIHTESSYKYDLQQFSRLAAHAGWRQLAAWTDERDYFAVLHYEAAP